MEKEFISFELAKELVELGFIEECFGWYNYGKLVIFGEDSSLDCIAGEEKERPLAPTYSQAFRFFREEYNLLGTVYANASGWLWEIHDNVGGTSREWSDFNGDCEESGAFTSFEKAETACLQQLIKIAKI